MNQELKEGRAVNYRFLRSCDTGERWAHRSEATAANLVFRDLQVWSTPRLPRWLYQKNLVDHDVPTPLPTPGQRSENTVTLFGRTLPMSYAFGRDASELLGTSKMRAVKTFLKELQAYRHGSGWGRVRWKYIAIVTMHSPPRIPEQTQAYGLNSDWGPSASVPPCSNKIMLAQITLAFKT